MFPEPTSQQYCLRARWVFPIDRPPIRDGVVLINRGRIVDVGRHPVPGPLVELDDVALLPALVNAHTHLDLSDLAQPLGHPGMRLPQWIPEVIRYSRQRGETTAEQIHHKRAAIRQGMAESFQCGVGLLGDIASSPWPTEARGGYPAKLVFFERLGADPALADSLMNAARELVSHASTFDPGTMRLGLSPHAPYSTSPALFARMIELAATHRLPVTTHLAESPEELELLTNRRGPFADMLHSLGPWQPDWLGTLQGCHDVLQWLRRAPRVLVAHGNYLDQACVDLLAREHHRMSVVFCPRTHRYFGHDRYPLVELLSAGVTLALGTDSRASSPDLDLWQEVRQVAADHPGVAPQQVLTMATSSGAQALGWADQLGSISPGKLAMLATVPWPSGEGDDPYAALVHAPHCRPLIDPAVGVQ